VLQVLTDIFLQLFKEYIELELKLREFDRCRTLYQKWLEVRLASSRPPSPRSLSCPWIPH
jgi:hypothetical protein